MILRKKLLSLWLGASVAAVTMLGACDDGNDGGETGRDKTTLSHAISTAADSGNITTLSGSYLASQFAQYRQDWSNANEYLDRTILFDPANIELYERAMVLAMQSGNPERAIELAEKVLEEDADNVLALMFIAVDHISRENYTEALDILKEMPSGGIANFIRPILVAWAQSASGKPQDDFTLISTSPLHAYHALLIADYLQSVKDFDKYFINIFASGGVDSHILEMVGDVYARHGQEERATQIYETLLSQYEGQEYLPKARVLQAKKDDGEGLENDRIATPAEGIAEAFYNMARVLYQEASDDSALVFLRLSHYLNPANEATRILMARVMTRNDHLDEAIALYQSIKPDSLNYLEALRAAAELMEEKNQIDQAIAYLETIYNQHKDFNALVQIGDVYRRAEKYDQAIKAYDRAASAVKNDFRPEHWHLLYARGMAYERNGNMKKSEQDLERAIEFRPDHPYLLNYLGYSWADQGKNLEEAKDLIYRAVDLKPDDGYIVDSLGWVYYVLGEYEKSVIELEKAVELVPYDPIINDHLGDAYWQVGRRHEARFQWQRALNHSPEDELRVTLEDKLENGIPLAKNNSAPEEAAAQKTAGTVTGE